MGHRRLTLLLVDGSEAVANRRLGGDVAPLVGVEHGRQVGQLIGRLQLLLPPLEAEPNRLRPVLQRRLRIGDPGLGRPVRVPRRRAQRRIERL